MARSHIPATLPDLLPRGSGASLVARPPLDPRSQQHCPEAPTSARRQPPPIVKGWPSKGVSLRSTYARCRELTEIRLHETPPRRQQYGPEPTRIRQFSSNPPGGTVLKQRPGAGFRPPSRFEQRVDCRPAARFPGGGGISVRAKRCAKGHARGSRALQSRDPEWDVSPALIVALHPDPAGPVSSGTYRGELPRERKCPSILFDPPTCHVASVCPDPTVVAVS